MYYLVSPDPFQNVDNMLTVVGNSQKTTFSSGLADGDGGSLFFSKTQVTRIKFL